MVVVAIKLLIVAVFGHVTSVPPDDAQTCPSAGHARQAPGAQSLREAFKAMTMTACAS